MRDCPFCAFRAADFVLETPLVAAVRDRFPVSPGHTLVILKKHVETYFDATPAEQAELWRVVEDIRRQLDSADPKPHGYNVGFNAGLAAGQTVPHLHIHVIPRYRGDMDDPRGGVRGVIPAKQKYSADPPNPFDALPTFIAGEEQHFERALVRAFEHADRADLVSAFLQKSGIELLLPHLRDAAARGATLRVLTGDYLGVTNADALRALFQLTTSHPRVEAALYETGGTLSFHPKSYLFRSGAHGVAYVGSSNLSHSALRHGVEWNLRLVSGHDRATLDALSARFEHLWTSPRTVRLSPDVIAAYELRAPVPDPARPEPRAPGPQPHAIQVLALEALAKTRREGKKRGLVVLATGLGKTYLSAFDFRALGGKRALFIAHREEILVQASEAWARVHPELTVGMLGSGRYEKDVDLLFASIQTLARASHLNNFARDHFDYVVVDEFHHAAAHTYRHALAHFQPRFLLGLTATPDRLDGASLLALCEDNEVFRRDVLDGISQRLLVPFRYFGVKDVADFAHIPWRSNRFDATALAAAVETEQRAEQALREYQEHVTERPRRTLAFCCSTTHADFMAAFFRRHGIKAAAVHSAPGSAPRAASLDALRAGELEVLCAVDVFNEGLDVPEINAVLMLRPTESPVIFLQQLGRGLRVCADKAHLTVVDFIGNHRSFLQKPLGLTWLTGEDLSPYVALRRIREQSLTLPEGCSVEIEVEALDMLAGLARVSRDDMLVYEYATFRDGHGRRPTAAQVFAAGVHVKPVRERYNGWFEFVAEQGDLTDAEDRVRRRHAAWFKDLLTTRMTRAYKMLALQVLLDEDALFIGMDVATNAERAIDLARQNVLLYRELRTEESRVPFSSAAIRRWRELPLDVWARGESTSRPWFRLTDEQFTPTFEVAAEDRPTFEAMTEELVELRLKEHLGRLIAKAPLDADTLPVLMTVSHSSGRPILRFDRTRRPDIPTGEVPVFVDGEERVLHFMKIAVNVATGVGGGPNILPALMRGWFGPSAGLAGSRHRVELVRADDRWTLRRHAAEVSMQLEPEQLQAPRIPFYADLAVACGAFAKNDKLVDATSQLPIESERALNPARHFVVRATGDSMEGGERPIHDGDLVLCEWWDGEGEVAGKPMLLVGHEDSATEYAAIKVPVRVGKEWVLRSWNPKVPDQAIPAGEKFEPRARVLGVVDEATGLSLWGLYDREAIARAFGGKYDRSWQVGHREIEVNGHPHTVLMVGLRKGVDVPIEHRYADQFLSRSEFQWESQASTVASHKKGKRIINPARDGRSIHLFVRYSDDEQFVYCGRVRYKKHEGEAPIRVWVELERPLPEGLWRLWRH